ncbi:carboxypeptidase-like regulatory domain-containing protein [Myxococcota bacterium]|nr:carboxypeptidase-like regulatory domain-containing protein [Myxococcota bacterium]
MSKIKSIIMVTGLFILACGGPVEIKGKVVDNQGTVIDRAEVTTEPETDMILTNSRGFFIIRSKINQLNEPEEITPGKYLIKVQKFGYENFSAEVEIQKGENVVKNLILLPKTPDIGEASPEEMEEKQIKAGDTSVPIPGI